MTASLQTLVAYKAWANRRLYEALTSLDDEILTAPQPIKFGSLIKTLQHVHDMDIVWRAHLLGRPHALTSRVPRQALGLAALSNAQRELDDWFVAYAAELPGVDIERPVRFTFLDGQPGRMTVFEILAHVVSHTTYHRGHVADMLYHAGARPPVTDYPVFVRERS